jgi:hypothetical protein
MVNTDYSVALRVRSNLSQEIITLEKTIANACATHARSVVKMAGHKEQRLKRLQSHPLKMRIQPRAIIHSAGDEGLNRKKPCLETNQ